MKAAFIVGASVGYVLGARAGKERYEQIKKVAQKVAENPKVQSAVSSAKEQAGSYGSLAAHKASELGRDGLARTNEVYGLAKQKVSDRRHKDDDGPLMTM